MPDEILPDGLAPLSEHLKGTLQIDGIPEDNGSHHQVEPTGPVVLVFKTPVPHLAKTIEEHSTGQGITGLAFVQPDLDPPAQLWILKPLEDEQGPFDASHLSQGYRQTILTGIAPQLPEHERCRDGALPDRGGYPVAPQTRNVEQRGAADKGLG